MHTGDIYFQIYFLNFKYQNSIAATSRVTVRFPLSVGLLYTHYQISVSEGPPTTDAWVCTVGAYVRTEEIDKAASV